MLFAKLIRDADKLDIFYAITVEDMAAIFWYKDFVPWGTCRGMLLSTSPQQFVLIAKG